ncbi:MAG: hypothetical protein ACTSUY_06125, partial [Alphaproteobacteria bacterium]
QITKITQTTNQLVVRQVVSGGRSENSASADISGSKRIATLEGSVASISGALATITTDLAQLRDRLKTIAKSDSTEQSAQLARMAIQVNQASQRSQSLEKKLARVSVQTEMVSLRVYYGEVAARLRGGRPFARALKALVTTLGAPSPALAEVAATGILSRTHLAQSLKTLVQVPASAAKPTQPGADQPASTTSWLDRLLDRANRSITISKSGDQVPGPANSTAESPGGKMLQRLAIGDLEGAIEWAAHWAGAGLRGGLASARTVRTAEQALVALGAQVDAAIARRAGEPS